MTTDILRHPLNIDARRRQVLNMLASLPLGVLLANPALAAEAQCCLQDIEISNLGGGRKIRASLALPAKVPAAAVILFHEWWGLNDQIKTVALDLAAKQGYLALAIDLYGGEVAQTADKASAMMAAVNPRDATETCLSWANWLKNNIRCNGKMATLGWCFGGGWSLNASLAAPMEATVIYYGNVMKKAAELKALKGPVLGHFAARDQWIDRTMVSTFEAEMTKAGKSLTAYWYDADHAFANPTGDHYNRQDANLAWALTTSFLSKNLLPA